MKFLLVAGLAWLVLNSYAGEEQGNAPAGDTTAGAAPGVTPAGATPTGATPAGRDWGNNTPTHFAGPHWDRPGSVGWGGLNDQAPRPTIITGFNVIDGPSYEPTYAPGVIDARGPYSGPVS